MDLIRLERREHAQSLADLVYATYGLTFHRDWLYDPDKMLALNARGDIVSVVAVDKGRVVGHLALIRPHFDVESSTGPVTANDVRECGLSIVHPDFRDQGLQAGLALRLSQEAWRLGVRGAILRCVTHHTWSQRSALSMGGTPVALLLGSIPRWVSYDHDDPSEREPLSTVVTWVPVHGPSGVSALARPQAMDWIDGSMAPTREQRVGPPQSAVLPEESDLTATWCGSRRLAQVHVTTVGHDLIDRLADTCRWLIGGHIAHVTVMLPGDQRVVADMHDELSSLGLFPAGWLPGYLSGGRDALVYQALAWSDLSPDKIQVVGKRARQIREGVLSGWQRSQMFDPMGAPRRGRVSVKVA